MSDETQDPAVFIEVNPVANVDELIERYGFHRAQIAWSADGKAAYLITDVIREAWAAGAAANATGRQPWPT